MYSIEKAIGEFWIEKGNLIHSSKEIAIKSTYILPFIAQQQHLFPWEISHQ